MLAINPRSLPERSPRTSIGSALTFFMGSDTTSFGASATFDISVFSLTSTCRKEPGTTSLMSPVSLRAERQPRIMWMSAVAPVAAFIA
ncbi:hypothetical protein D3C87_1764120 [compost metagenome]